MVPDEVNPQSLLLILLTVGVFILPQFTQAQSPELSIRDFSSSQIKKGVRSIGFGGDGATWGNYGLVWKDAGTALLDYGNTDYTNGNDPQFAALGVTSPPLWHQLAIYVIAMYQETNDMRFSAKSPGLGPSAVPLIGKGLDRAIFSKIAMPLGKGVSVGVLLAGETSQFHATAAANSNQSVQYSTQWRPSGGFGVAWQPRKTMLFGFRGLLNNDRERRTDPAGTTEGTAHSAEYRLGASISPWKGGWLDGGATRLERHNTLAGTHTVAYHPNLGFEQSLRRDSMAFRFGLDETSPTAGFTLKFSPLKLDVAYVDNLARSRVGNLFGSHSNSLLATLTLDYRAKRLPPAHTGTPQ